MLKPPSVPINTKVKKIEPLGNKMVSHNHTNLPVNAIVRHPYPRTRDSQGQETFLAPFADDQIRNMKQSPQTTIPFSQH